MHPKKDKNLPTDTDKLRSRAEEILKGVQPADTQSYRTQGETLKLLHELQVTQIELEMQNHELRQTRYDVEIALDKHNMIQTIISPTLDTKNIKVLLVDDHKIMRDGLASLLGGAEDISIVAEASGGGEAIEKALEHLPDVVVMDLTLPDIGGIEATRRILANNPGISVLVLSMLMDRNCVLESLEAGARGYLAKDCAAEELVVAIRTVFAGKPYFCAGATEIMIKGFAPGPASQQIAPTLTQREQEVLKLTAEGNNTKEIAFTLGVSVKMIETHRMNVRKKLGLNSIAQLTTYAVRTGLISIE